MSATLYDQLQAVTDEASFLAFVAALHADRLVQEQGENTGWQAQGIAAFLEAALTWGETTQLGRTQGLRDASPWKRCAMLLYSGKVYD
ncbi:hypothetical protein [Chitinolyticbacter meiyuanensis]|uniref:hypothetical protein n=1 Tax=Chitinolyticbacter meiyuanensis TaxID=682798 RepID=UPI0011E5C646|nr:hypothetical protein [Chitinolyticbacter meiyuanensis]